MHKYVPRIWIVRCDDATRLRDLYSHPASSFKFNETEFIAVTAYQVRYLAIAEFNFPFQYVNAFNCCNVTLATNRSF